VKKKTPPKPAPLPSLRSATLHRRWILFLVLQANANDAVRRLLAIDDLPCPSDSELDAMRTEHAPPKGFNPLSEKHAASVAFIQKLGVEPLFRQHPEVNEAVGILRHPRPRELAEAALILGVPAAPIARMLKAHLHHEVTARSVETYRQTFFNTSAVVRGQLKVLVEARVRLAVRRAVSGEDDEVSARKAIAADPRTIASALPSSPIALQAVFLALGLSPGRQELGEVIQQMETLAVIRAGQALLRGEPDDGQRAEAFTGVLRQIQGIKEMVVVPDAELQKKLTGISLRTDTRPVVTAAQLMARGDQVTVDLMPVGSVGSDLGGDVEDEQAG
jgi:hypothetical protein